MPREQVPYGGAICRLKERITELFDLVGEKLHSINGVQGDGQGNVKIVSGDPAVVITNDAAQNEIEIALDNSELPSAAVQSVNGETGAVVLDGNDIDAGFSTPGTTITQALGNNSQQLQVIGGLVQQEILDRQNGDAALQTNINAVQAGIPAATAAAVAADPTVAQLAADVPNKVDKITSGSTKRAYTHTGSVQDDTPVVNGIDANSIGLRDANGRMYAADPADGATDRTLTTANWVSQTGEGRPNNLLHSGGNELITATKTTKTALKDASFYSTLQTQGEYIIGKFPTPTQTVVINAIVCSRAFIGFQLWNISVFSNNTITYNDQLGGTMPTLKHMVKDGEHFIAVDTIGGSMHYSIKWFMCRRGGTLIFMDTEGLPTINDGSYVDVNA